MRGLLVVNPAATTTTERVRDVLVSALSADLAVETVVTKGRGHAAELGQRAVETGVDVVISLGGDGTVNEVANGLLYDGPKPGMPALAVVPGGSTNVFARALGYSASPVEATGELLAHLRDGKSRSVGLGHARWADESRWFTFCAGVGLDAEVVGRVERRRSGGRPNSAGLFLRSAFARYAGGLGHARPRIHLDLVPSATAEATGAAPREERARGREVEAAVVCNTVPWTYLGDRPVRACPEASFTSGLDLLGLRRVHLRGLARLTNQMLVGERGPHGGNVVLEHDLASLRLTAEPAAPFQMDGEYLGEHTEVALTSYPSALRVIG
jgi:diacylglycerol kinase family enzyme